MALEGINSKKELHSFIAKHLSRSHPIRSPEFLFGREKELRQVERALYSDGTHVFIVGDRGVGKTSIATIAATSFQEGSKAHIHIDCSPRTTFAGIVANIAYEALKHSGIFERSSESGHGTSISLIGLNIGKSLSEGVRLADIETGIRDVTDAVRVFKWLADNYSDPTTVVIDEFDRIRDPNERNRFADLIKHFGNQMIPVKLIITGIATNVTDLIGEHPSCARQIDSIDVPKLNFDDRWQIIREPLNNLDVTIGRELEIRIALISDGYPYYVHLLTERLIWELNDDPNLVHTVNEDHFQTALGEAIETCSAEYKVPYEKAVNSIPNIEEILWSTADTDYMVRTEEEMFASYLGIMRQISRSPVSREEYKKGILNLAKPSNGPILQRAQKRKPIFDYKERMLRGYVRLQAESHGVRLYNDLQKDPKPLSANAASSRYGYRASTIPKEVRFANEPGRKAD